MDTSINPFCVIIRSQLNSGQNVSSESGHSDTIIKEQARNNFFTQKPPSKTRWIVSLNNSALCLSELRLTAECKHCFVISVGIYRLGIDLEDCLTDDCNIFCPRGKTSESGTAVTISDFPGIREICVIMIRGSSPDSTEFQAQAGSMAVTAY